MEGAVLQVMTYLVENEQAALIVPARFVGRVHLHFRETMQFLATQLADEARHIEVFTRRARLCGQQLGSYGAGGRASLQTLVDEPDWGTAAFLLSGLGEGTFLSLLSFLEHHPPDPVTARIAHLSLQDEARHIAFAMGHLGEQLRADPPFRARLAAAVRRRHDVLASTAGLSDSVHDALVVLAEANGPGRRSPGGGPRCSSSSKIWTRGAAGVWSGSASAMPRPPTSQSCTRATSCKRRDRVHIGRSWPGRCSA